MSQPNSQGSLEPHKVVHRSARDVLGVFGTRVAMFPVTFVVGVLVARALGPSDRGVYAFLGLVSSFLLPFLTFGFGASIIYFISSQRYQARDVTLTCILVGATQGFLSALIVGGLWWFGLAGKTANQTSGWLLLPFLLIQPLNGASLMASRILLGSSWFGVSNLLSLLSPLLQAILMLVLVIGLHLGLPGAVAVATTTAVVSTVVTILAVWTRYQPRWNWDGAFLRDGLAYGWRAWLGDVALRLNLRVDQVLLSYFAPAAQLGLYTVAVNWTELLWIIPDSLGIVAFNRIAAAKSTADRLTLAAQVHRALLIVVAVLGITLALLCPFMVTLLYGKSFEGAVLPLILLLPGTIVLTTGKVLTKYFGGSGMPGKSSLCYAGGSALSLLLLFVLLPSFGITGAAIASTIGYFFTAALGIYLLHHTHKDVVRGWFSLGWSDVAWSAAQIRAAMGRGPKQ